MYPHHPGYPPGYPAPTTANDEQLNTLGVLFWVYAAFIALTGLSLLAFAILPAILLASAPPDPSGPPPAVVGGIFAVTFGVLALFLLGKAVVMGMAGSALRQRKSYVLIMVASALAVMNIPLGTALAVYTFIHLNKPEVKARFAS